MCIREKFINLTRMQMEYLPAVSYYGNPFGIEYRRPNNVYGSVPSDKQKCQPKEKHEFTIKGIKIMAASKKDAIKKFNHRKK